MPAASVSEEADIQWGTIQASASKAKIFYTSFFSEGVEYKLFDNVQVYNEENEEPYIGKIIKLWEEKQSGMKKVLIRWFLRLRDLDPQMEGDPKELYLAFGKGKGVTNENDLEVICGKSRVLCTSKDVRNKQPSASDLKNADFFFSKIYNVDLQHLSPVQRVVDKLGCEAVYNKDEWVTETSKNKEEQFKQSKSLPISNNETSLMQDAECIHESKSMQTDFGNKKEQKLGQGSVLKRQHTPIAEELARKKLKTSASTITPTLIGAASKDFQKEEKVTPSDNVIVCKNLKSYGQEAQSKPNLPACDPAQIDAKSKKPSRLVEAIKMDGQEVQSKVDIPACAPRQVEAKSLNVEKLSSFKKNSAVEISSPKVDDALGLAVPSSKSSRQLAETKGLSTVDQRAKEAIQTSSVVNDPLGGTLTGTGNSTDSLPKIDRSAVNPASFDTSKSKEMIPEVRRDPPKLADNSPAFIEMENSAVNKTISNLKVKREAEVTAKGTASVINSSLEAKNGKEKVDSSPMPMPESSVRKESSDAASNPKIGTGAEIEKKSVSTTEPVKAVENWRIFKELPWEENLQQGLSFGKVLLLHNLDPSLTSNDVRDMLKLFLQGVSDARTIPQETACPYGQALAIFDSRLLADSALQEMEKKCLVLASNKRPIIATKFKETLNFTRFPGHLALDKLRLSRNEDYKKAVSTSHSSQPNTIEYEMAMEWRRLQEITQTCRLELFEKQRKETEEVKKSCTRKGF